MLRYLVSMSVFLSLSASAFAWADHNHVKHNMVLFGEQEVFASHIVYKEPHNFQVILSLDIDPDSLQKYLTAKAEHPSEQLLYLLDAMDIKEIDSANGISGSVFYIDGNGEKHEVIPNLTLQRSNFKIVYFDEVPLSLAKESTSSIVSQMHLASIKCDDSDVGRVPGCTPTPRPCPKGRKC